ncbi:hypothetical protein K1719_009300 [Acacia pycnantha]|nr:hypothetical protein K1719_009300 [Acacia pycnantha]
MELVLVKKPSVTSLRSTEEDDLLLRSAKKVKNAGCDVNDQEWPKLGPSGSAHWQNGESFADKLQGISKDHHSVCMEEDPNKPNAEEDLDSDLDDGEPICKLWARKGVFSLIHLGNGFFVVKFTNQDDYINALTGGPWLIFDHYLTVRPWEPNFHPMKATTTKVVQKHRRPKKGGKDKQSGIFRQEGGSRFEVLAEEGAVGEAGIPVSTFPVVQFSAGEKKEVLHKKAVSGSRGRNMQRGKRIAGSRVRWEELVCRVNADKINAKRKESREEQDLSKGVDMKVVTIEKARGVEYEVVAPKAGAPGTMMGEMVTGEMVVSGDEDLEDTLDDFSQTPHDPGDVVGLNELRGKFWAGPTNEGTDLDMVEVGSSAEITDSVVPESQLD